MDIRCKVCRFKFDVPADESQVEMVVNCPRCGTPQVINLKEIRKELEIKEKEAQESATKSTNADSENAKAKTQNTTSQQSENKESSTNKKVVNRDFNHPTPSASLKIDSAVNEEEEQKKTKENIFRAIRVILCLAIIGTLLYFAYNFYLDQKSKMDNDNNTYELFNDSIKTHSES